MLFGDRRRDRRFLPAIKYVITLDTDTQLPREAARQLVGTMAHPLNRPQFDPARGIVTEGYSLLQPRVDVSLPSAGSFLVRSVARRRSRDRSLHARGLGCVSGSFPRRLVHRQRHLRCGCLSSAPWPDAFPENTNPEPRLAGIGLCPLRLGERRETLRRISVPLRRGRRPAASLDSRRLADHAVAAAAGARTRTDGASPIRSPACRGGKFSTTCGAVSSRSRCCFFCSASWLLVPRLGVVGNGARPRDHRAAGIAVGSLVELLRKPEQLPWRCICGNVGRQRTRRSARSYSPWRSCPTTLSSVWTRSGGRCCACWSRADASWNGKPRAMWRGSARTDLAGFYATMWIAPVVALGGASFFGRRCSRRNCRGCPAVPRSLARGALDRLVDQPADRAAGAGT